MNIGKMEYSRDAFAVCNFDFEDTPDVLVHKIESLTTQMMKYWKDAHGWAPTVAADLLAKSMLDLQASLSASLRHWLGELSGGDLILAWTNLGAMIEGQMKLFLSVYYSDYLNDNNAIKKTRKTGDQFLSEVVPPDGAKFEDIRIFFRDHVWRSDENWDKWVYTVQQRRNNIHAFKYRNDLGTSAEYFESLFVFLQFLRMINDRLPYHDESFRPYPFVQNHPNEDSIKNSEEGCVE
jgi:hypothetical protein